MKSLTKKLKTKIASLVSFYRLTQYLFKVSRDPELHPILRSYLGEFPLCLFTEPFLWLKLRQNAKARFQKDKQRPYAFYAPHLSAVPFGEPDRICEFLEANLAAIASEFALCAPPEVPTPSQALVNE